MRLTCPNCDAQYEVDDNAIPESGRDVQCSNCGHAWFQLPPDVEEQLRDEAQTFGDAPPGQAPPAVGPGAPPEPDTLAEPDATPGPAGADDSGDEPAPRSDSDDEAAPGETEPEGTDLEDTAAEAPPAPPRRELDAGLKNLLREEAERESAARKAEGDGLETQPDLGLDEPATAHPSAEVTKRRIERLMSEQDGQGGDTGDEAHAAGPADPIEDAEVEPVAGPRRDLLPDIEEINSTLRANSERGADEPGASADAETPAEARRGFRRGFGTILLIAVLLALLYIFAPQIAARVPAAAGPLNGYVQTVDKGRLWLDGLMEKATNAINGDKEGAGQ